MLEKSLNDLEIAVNELNKINVVICYVNIPLQNCNDGDDVCWVLC